jgi:hypothetical protein
MQQTQRYSRVERKYRSQREMRDIRVGRIGHLLKDRLSDILGDFRSISFVCDTMMLLSFHTTTWVAPLWIDFMFVTFNSRKISVLCRKRCEENRVCHDNDIKWGNSWRFMGQALPTENICWIVHNPVSSLPQGQRDQIRNHIKILFAAVSGSISSCPWCL